MNPTDYPTIIFGSALEAKRLYVQELRDALFKEKLSSAELDALLQQSADWPRVQEVLDDPNLFTLGFHQALEWASLSGAKDCERIPSLAGGLLTDKILAYISVPGVRDTVIAEFQGMAIIQHISAEHPEVELEKILNNEPLRPGSPNHISPDEHAMNHILSCILHDIGTKII